MTLTERVHDLIFEEYIRKNYEEFNPVRLPTEDELADHYQVSKITIRRAVDAMVRNNYVHRQRRNGTFVVDRRKLEPHYTIGLVIPGDAFYEALAGRIEGALTREGHRAPRFPANDADMFLEQLDAQGYELDGIIVCGYLVDHARLAASGIPYVLAGGEGYQNADNVVFDLRYGVRIAVEHLIEHGHRDILFLSHYEPDMQLASRINRNFIFESSSRYQGYCDALEAAGIAVDPANVIHLGNSKRNTYLNLRELVAAGKLHSSAIFASNDTLAEGAAMALAEAGIRIPEQVSLVGCNNLMPEKDMLLPLTTLDLRLDDVGGSALRLLFAQLPVNREHEYRSISIIPRLVRPESTVATCRK